MFSANLIHKAAIAAGAAMALAAGTAAQAGVVVSSSGPSAAQYPRGKKLDDNATITLQAGDTVTVLSNGGTRTISGPGPHRVAARGTSRRSTFEVLTKQNTQARRFGATRAPTGTGASSSPNLWHVDVTKSGTMCVPALDTIQFFRPGGDQASTYMISSSANSEHHHVAFAKDASLAEWDTAASPFAEGMDYIITGPDGESRTVSFKVLAEPAATPEAMAEQLVTNGCDAQLDLLADKLV